jgi:hypothetical protein
MDGRTNRKIAGRLPKSDPHNIGRFAFFSQIQSWVFLDNNSRDVEQL